MGCICSGFSLNVCHVAAKLGQGRLLQLYVCMFMHVSDNIAIACSSGGTCSTVVDELKYTVCVVWYGIHVVV